MDFDSTSGFVTVAFETSRLQSAGLDDLAIYPTLGRLYGSDEQPVYSWNAPRLSLAFPDVGVTHTVATGPMPTDIAIA